jgi:hypothetical protein
MTYHSGRETVGLFGDAAAFEAAIDDLLLKGFDRSLLSLMADEATVSRALGHLVDTSDAAADDPAIPRIPFIGMRSLSAMRAMAVSTLASVGVCVVAGTVVATGGAVALALAASAAFGGASGALGLALGKIMQRRYAQYLLWQLNHGGILLWVATPTPEQEAAAAEILNRRGAHHVHAHDLPPGEPSRASGVSENLAWINKPLGALVTSGAARSGAGRSSTVH